MEIADYEPQAWFLLRDGGEYYLSVRCQQSFVDYSVLIRLSPGERDLYRTIGNTYADALATAISDAPRRFRERDQENEFGSRVTQSVIAWRSAKEGDAVIPNIGQK